MDIKRLLKLRQESGDGITHYMDGDIVVATVLDKVVGLRINAQLGDDKNITNFSFDYSGPIAVIYTQRIKLENLESREPQGCVMAIMSAITFADISMWIALENVVIVPTTVMEYDTGIPELYELAKALICQHAGNEWDNDYLRRQFAHHLDAIVELHSRLTSWTA